ncbi:hypothetical protein VTI74DRAFT_9435 [Chaetomium olivicolor]
MSYYLPQWFQTVQGASPLDSRVRVLASVISQIRGSNVRASPLAFIPPFLPSTHPLASGLASITTLETPCSWYISSPPLNRRPSPNRQPHSRPLNASSLTLSACFGWRVGSGLPATSIIKPRG